MKAFRPALAIVTLGLVTFGLVFALLELSPTPSAAAPSASIAATSSAETPAAAPASAADSVAPAIHAGDMAIGVPTAGAEALLRDVQRGDRLDVLASLPGQAQSPPVTVVVVRGATVLRAASGSDPVLLDVQAHDAMVLAHLVLGGTRLGYVVWPLGASRSGSEEAPPLDEATARTLLGLTPQRTQVPSPVAATTPLPSQTPQPAQPTPTAAVGPASGFLYQVQPGDTWERIAATFGLPVSQVRQWNEAAAEVDPVPGRLVFIPRAS